MPITLAEITLIAGIMMQSQTNLPEEDVVCMARNMFFEYRHGTIEDQLAIGDVTLNRVASPDFPDTICDVVNGEFSWTLNDPTADLNNPSERAAFELATLLTIELLEGNTINQVGTATYYYNPSLADPNWGHVYEEVTWVGEHRFMQPGV